MIPLHIAARLASALRMMPCACIEIGAWPRFKDVKAHPVRQCARCGALEEWNAYTAIVQMPNQPDIKDVK